MKTIEDIPMLSGGGLDGHAKEFRDRRGDFFLRLQQETGDIGRFRFFHMNLFAVHSPELVHELLVEKAKHFEKTLALKIAFYPLAGDGLFTSEGELWKRQRKLMSPLFHPGVIRSYADTMNEVIARYLAEWKDGEVVDVTRMMQRITMAVAGKALFDSDTFDDADELGAAIQAEFEYLGQVSGTMGLTLRTVMAQALLNLDSLPEWLAHYRDAAVLGLKQPPPLITKNRPKLLKAIHTLDSKVQEMIDDRRRVGLSRPDLLTRLLSAQLEDGSGMSDKQVRDEAVTLFVAGHETTAIGMTWAMYFLSRKPEVYRRWKEEVQAGVGGMHASASEVAELVYTQGVFKEALRLYPPAFVLDRISVDGVQIGDYMLPPKTILFAVPYAMGRNASVWPDPESFDPGRFSPETEAARPRGAYLPFGAGPRVCIGASFAQLEAALILAQIAKRFEFEPVDSRPMEATFLTALRPARPVRVKVRKLSS